MLHANKTFAGMKIIPERGILLRIAWYIIATGMGFGFLSFVPRNRVSIISEIGTRTLPIFILHTHLYSLLKVKTDIFAVIGKSYGVLSIFVFFGIAVAISLAFGNKWVVKPFDTLMKYKFTLFLNNKVN